MIPGLTKIMGTTKPRPKIVTFTGNMHDVNLRTVFGAWYPGPIVPQDTILFVINPGVYIGASSTGAWALQMGYWADLPASATLTLQIIGRIQGAGGQGGGTNSNGGLGGGGAMYIDRATNIVANGAQIFGGGGGGGNSQLIQGGTQFNGGGGCGYTPGLAGGPGPPGDGWWIMGQDGTTENGGTGFRTTLDPNCRIGDGGGPGQPGTTAYSNAPGYYYDYAGGAAGWSVYGWGNISFGNWDGTKNEFVYTGAHNADIRGPIA
jgi:hypothetical protein